MPDASRGVFRQPHAGKPGHLVVVDPDTGGGPTPSSVHDPDTDRVVLLQRGEHAKFAQGMWDLPVGKSEAGEPITQTAVRELREETGLIVKPEALRIAHIIHGAWGVESPNGFLTVVFASREWSGEPENREPHKHAQVRWTPTDALPEQFVPSTAEALRSYLAGGPAVSLHGWR